MRNFVRTVLLTICILMLSVPVFASSDIRVQLNGEIIDFTDANGNKVESQIINSRTMVPMRKIFEVMGAEVEWINDTRSIIATTDELEIGLQIDNEIATVKNNGGEEKKIKLDSVPVIVNGRTLVPVRFIAESLDKKVGWDAQNRAVIIIDPNSVENIIKENASNLYELLSTETKPINTYDMNMELDGHIEMMYDNEMTNLDVTGDIDLKFSGNMLAMNVDLKATGSESVIESIGTDKIKLEMIVDGEKEELYIKSDLIENSNGKWVKYVINEEKKGELRELLKSAALPSSGGINEFVSSLISEENLTLNYYNELEATLEIISQIMGNDNLKVTGTKDKTFKFEAELKDILKFIRQDITAEEEKELLDTIELEFGFESKMKDGISEKSKLNFVMGQKDEMRLELNLDGEFETYNEDVYIQIPSKNNVIDGEELQQKEREETIKMAQFSGFASEMSWLEEATQVALFEAKAEEVLKGNTRTDAQLYNYIARGGESVV